LPAVLTVIDDVVAFVLHNNDPVAVVDSVEVPLQLSTTFTTGVDGVVLGAAVPVPGKLVQPFTVVVTV
jgi:putative N-acetylmannosamine-6-phosphate epimerase